MYHQKKVSQRCNDPLTRISWQNFERLLATYYAGQGYRVEHVGTGGLGMQFDGGIDLKLYRDDQYLIVQCKHWNVRQVTHNPVHELLGVMLTQHATGAIVITSGEFTKAAKAAATKESRVTLIDGAALREMLGPIAGMFAPDEADNANAGGRRGFGDTAANPSGYRPNRSRRSRSRNPLPGMAFAIVVGVIGYAVLMHTIKGLVPKPLVQPAVVIAPSPSFVRPVVRAPVATFVAAPVPVTPPSKYQVTHMTAAEQREWQRKNDEAMKILEKTTPALAR
jgi:restriction system protein